MAKWVDIWYLIHHMPPSLEEYGGVRMVQLPLWRTLERLSSPDKPGNECPQYEAWYFHFILSNVLGNKENCSHRNVEPSINLESIISLYLFNLG